MIKYNFYVNKKGYGKSNAELQKQVNDLCKEFVSLANSYCETLELLNEDYSLFTTVCLTEIAFHVNNVNKINNIRLKKED